MPNMEFPEPVIDDGDRDLSIGQIVAFESICLTVKVIGLTAIIFRFPFELMRDSMVNNTGINEKSK